MNVVAEVNNGQQAIDQFRIHQPDVAILDLKMPEVSGVEAIDTIRVEFPTAAIIMFSIYETDEDVYRGLRAGAKAYLLKDTPCQEILEVIRTVSGGQRYIPTGIGTKLAARMERPDLSDRKHQVLALMAQGKKIKISLANSTFLKTRSSFTLPMSRSNSVLAIALALLSMPFSKALLSYSCRSYHRSRMSPFRVQPFVSCFFHEGQGNAHH
jgi:CheY-like chemotaxis protein